MLKLIFLFATLILLIATSNGCIKEGLLDGRSSGSIWKRDTIGISEGANLDPGIIITKYNIITFKYTANKFAVLDRETFQKSFTRRQKDNIFL